MITIFAHLNIIWPYVGGGFQKLNHHFKPSNPLSLFIFIISTVVETPYPLMQQLAWPKPVFLFSAPLHVTQSRSYGRFGYQTWAWFDNSSSIVPGGLPNFSAGRMDNILRKVRRIWSSASFRVCAESSGRQFSGSRGLIFGHRGRYSTSFRVAGYRCSLVQ